MVVLYGEKVRKQFEKDFVDGKPLYAGQKASVAVNPVLMNARIIEQSHPGCRVADVGHVAFVI